MIKELRDIIKNKYQEEYNDLIALSKEIKAYNRRTQSYTIPYTTIEHLSDIDEMERQIAQYVSNYKKGSVFYRLQHRSDFKKELEQKQIELTKIKAEIKGLAKPLYYDNQEQLSEQIKEVRDKIDAIEEVNSLQQLDISLPEAIDLLNEYNIPFCLNEDDISIAAEANKYYNSSKYYSSLSELILVHKTSFAPSDDKIKSSVNSGAFFEKHFVLDKVSKSYIVTNFRNTIHFCLNGEVTSHAYGNFDNRRYAILQPMADDFAKKVKGFNPVDTYFEGNFYLNGAYILCPFEERITVAQKNPQSLVVPYKGDSVDEYANTFLTVLGYQCEKIGMWNWDNERADFHRINPQIIEQYKFEYIAHNDSIDSAREGSLRVNDHFNKFADLTLDSIRESELNPYEIYQMFPKLLTDNGISISYSDRDGKKPSFVEIDKIFTESGCIAPIDLPALIKAMNFENLNNEANSFWINQIANEVANYNKTRNISHDLVQLYRKTLYVKQIIDSDLINYPVEKLKEAQKEFEQTTKSHVL